MTLAAGDYAPGSVIENYKAGSTVAVTKGRLMMWDTSGDGWLLATATTTTFGHYAVCVSAAAAGHTMVKVCTSGFVAVDNASTTLEPNDMLQPSISTAGKVSPYVARTINVTTAASEWRRACGRYVTDNEDIGDGTAVQVDAAASDVVIIHLREIA